MPASKKPGAPKTVEEYRALLLSFIGSLTLDEHMGDVSNTIVSVLARLGVDVEWENLSDLGTALGKMGVKTLYGTELYDPDEEE